MGKRFSRSLAEERAIAKNEIVVSSSLVFLFGIVSAKWAMELGYSQLLQLTLFCVALFLGPLVLLVLYLRLIRQRQAYGKAGAQMFGISQADNQMKLSSETR